MNAVAGITRTAFYVNSMGINAIAKKTAINSGRALAEDYGKNSAGTSSGAKGGDGKNNAGTSVESKEESKEEEENNQNEGAAAELPPKRPPPPAKE